TLRPYRPISRAHRIHCRRLCCSDRARTIFAAGPVLFARLRTRRRTSEVLSLSRDAHSTLVNSGLRKQAGGQMRALHQAADFSIKIGAYGTRCERQFMPGEASPAERFAAFSRAVSHGTALAIFSADKNAAPAGKDQSTDE